jgi:hypothetical protein
MNENEAQKCPFYSPQSSFAIRTQQVKGNGVSDVKTRMSTGAQAPRTIISLISQPD